MHGYLRIFVLRELAGKERTGYDLMKSFENFTGTKMPSPGTIYPLLSSLLKKGMVTVFVKNNRKIYSASKKGEKILYTLMSERKKVLENIIKMFGNIYSRKEISMMRRRMALSLNVMSGEKKNLARDFDVLNEMRESVFDFVMSNKYSKQRSEFRAIITDTSKKLRKLLGKNEKHN